MRAVESFRLLQNLSATEAEVDAASGPRRLAHSFAVDERRYDADLYLPGDAPKSALVLVPGVTREGKDDRRLIAFARALSRARFLVLVPDIESLRDLRVAPDDAVAIGDAVEYLARKVGQPAVGLVAISYAVGPALISAVQERSRLALRYLVAIGGYYDLEAAITFFTTGYYRESPEHAWHYIKPSPYGKWVFLRSNLQRVGDRVDRALLREIANRKLRDPEADIARLASRLGSEGKSVYALLINSEPGRAPSLIAELPEAIRKDIDRLNPKAHDLSRLTARLFLIHGRDDQVIPFTESQALQAAAPEHQAELYIVDSLVHVDFSPIGLADVLRLWRVIYRLLELRDRLPAPDPEAIVGRSDHLHLPQIHLGSNQAMARMHAARLVGGRIGAAVSTAFGALTRVPRGSRLGANDPDQGNRFGRFGS